MNGYGEVWGSSAYMVEKETVKSTHSQLNFHHSSHFNISLTTIFLNSLRTHTADGYFVVYNANGDIFRLSKPKRGK